MNESEEYLQAHFDREASYDYHVGYPERDEAWFCKNIRPRLVSLVNGKRVIDIGCGSGVFTRALWACGPKEVVGVDFSEKRLAFATAHAMGEEYVYGDVTNPMLPILFEKPFSVAITSAVIQHIHPERRMAAFHTIRQLLPDGGRFILIDEINYRGLDNAPWDGFYQRLELRDVPSWFSLDSLVFAAHANDGKPIYIAEYAKS